MIRIDERAADAAIAEDVSGEAFRCLLDMLERYGSRSVTVLEAYFDESERHGGVFSLAGFVFVPAQARKFATEWQRVLGNRVCHATDLMNRRDAFSDLSPRDVDMLLRRLVPIIRKRMTMGVAYSCRIDEFNRHMPVKQMGFHHAYSFLAHLCMVTISEWMTENGYVGSTAYMFESGHLHQSDANRVMDEIAKVPMFKTWFRYGLHAFLPKEAAPPLQAADLLAWEWAKYRDETMEQNKRGLRKSLEALIGSAMAGADPMLDVDRRFRVGHVDNNTFASYADKLERSKRERMNNAH